MASSSSSATSTPSNTTHSIITLSPSNLSLLISINNTISLFTRPSTSSNFSLHPSNSSLASIHSSSSIISASFSLDSSRFATATRDKQVRTFDAATLAVAHETSAQKRPTSLCFTPDALFVGDRFGEVWDVTLLSASASPDTTPTPRCAAGHLAEITQVCYTSSPPRLLTADVMDKVRISRYPDTCRIEHFLLGHGTLVAALATTTHQDSTLAITGGGDGTLRLWDVASGEALSSVNLANTPADCVFAIDPPVFDKPVVSQIQVDPTDGTIAVLVYPLPVVLFFRIDDDNKLVPRLSSMPLSTLNLDAYPSSIAFVDGNLWVITDSFQAYTIDDTIESLTDTSLDPIADHITKAITSTPTTKPWILLHEEHLSNIRERHLHATKLHKKAKRQSSKATAAAAAAASSTSSTTSQD